MQLVILSGRSGSGKTTALQAMEDLGFYCVDNLPVGMLPALLRDIEQHASDQLARVAVGIDARNVAGELARFDSVYQALLADNNQLRIVYLDAQVPTLMKRFSATRRKHPLTNDQRSLAEAIEYEARLLDPIATRADYKIDTSDLNVHDLRELIAARIAAVSTGQLALLIESFAFKHGVPADADLVFDMRCLPNPHWISGLRELTGRDKAVTDYLESHKEVLEMFSDLVLFLRKWLPHFQENDRSYLTVAIGCTGGQHRSVYMAERLAALFRSEHANVQLRHRELS